MKKIIISILLLAFSTSFMIAEKQNEMQKARSMFKKLMETAHPLPQKNIKNKFPAPYAEPINNPLFINYNLIETEIDQDPMQNESSIAVNPLNPNILIGSSVDYRANSSTWIYVSEDGGYHWKNYNLGHPFPGWRSTNDPSVAIDGLGNAYLVYGGFGYRDDTSHGESFGENGVFISISTDGGKTWSTENTHIPVILHKGTMTMDSLFEDKYYISVDNASTSPLQNTLYIPWKRVTPRDSATQIVISRSKDNGRTWSTPLPVSPRKSGTSQDTTYGQSFPLVATGPNGEVYLVWNDGIEHGVGFARALDTNFQFSEPEIIHRYNIFGTTANLANNPNDEPVWRHSLKGIVRAETYPVIVVDTTISDFRGNVYLTCAGDNVPNIYFSKSTNKGDDWSEPVIIHSDTTNDQFWQWMAVDPNTGNIGVMYLDSRDDPDNIMVECYVSLSTDGGETWTDRKISDFNSDIRRNPFYNHFAGDYSGMAFYNGKIYPSWVDMRNAENNIKDSDVFSALVNVNSPSPVENFKALSIPEKVNSIELKWDYSNERAFGQPMSSDNFYFILKRENESFKIPSDHRMFLDTGLTQYHLYHYKIYVVSGIDTSIIRIDSAFAGGSKELAAAKILEAVGYANNDIKIKLNLPQYRADNTTELINLDKAIIFDRFGTALDSIDLNPEQAGQTIDYSFNAAQRGYYTLTVKVLDDNIPPNESNLSNEMEVYTGPMNDYSDDFDSGLKRYKFVQDWDVSNEISASTPNCLTDSPNKNYKKLVENYLILYPILIENGHFLNITFNHIALFYKRDSAKIEISSDGAQSWKSIANFNETSYSYWTDGILNEQDWKYESINYIPKNPDTDTLIIRFNIDTKLGGSGKGWFIDDLSVLTKEVSVNDNRNDSEIVLYPNPARDFIYINNDNPHNNIHSIEVYSQLGKKVKTSIIQESKEFTIDISELPLGLYFIKINHENNISTLKFVKIN